MPHTSNIIRFTSPEYDEMKLQKMSVRWIFHCKFWHILESDGVNNTKKV